MWAGPHDCLGPQGWTAHEWDAVAAGQSCRAAAVHLLTCEGLLVCDQLLTPSGVVNSHLKQHRPNMGNTHGHLDASGKLTCTCKVGAQ